jgi:hypothetical protein
MGITTWEAVIVDQYLELAFAQRRAVEMRETVHCCTRGVHRRLVYQMYLAKEGRIARYRAR